MKPVFQSPQRDWLAKWAGANLDAGQLVSMAHALHEDDETFDYETWAVKAYALREANIRRMVNELNRPENLPN